MASVNDWAAKAARQIAEFERQSSQERLAVVLEWAIKPLVDLVRESRREHYHSDDSWYCCARCTHSCDSDEPDHEHDDSCCLGSNQGIASLMCDCGAEAWNRRIEAALAGDE